YLEPSLFYQVDCLSRTKQQIVKCVETNCSLSKAFQFQEPEVNLTEEIVGIVALLATVNDDRLSRVFAEYLTESYMLAVVFKSYKSASSLEKFTKDGKVSRNCAIHKIVSQVGAKVDKRFTAIFLDEIRPYLDVLEESGHERKLALQDPCLPSGKMPHGFLGHAVNMINLDMRHVHIKTSSGYGLRETLFYRLFGELQVYQTREDIEHAKGCIKSGAVSLDGQIMRDHGIICLGD
ncbi:hypothetical protein Taro_043616, partial [Colocasia esculenta]|nr:hypothetical protein [Colocasia esculenta]